MVNLEVKQFHKKKRTLKISKLTSAIWLTNKLMFLIRDFISVYSLEGYNYSLLFMARPWLSDNDFIVPIKRITELLEKDNIITDPVAIS